MRLSFRNPFTLLGLAGFVRQLHFTFPIMILIYGAKGVSIGDYFLIQGIYMWAILFMEVPSGYFGDLFSRRLNLAFSAFLNVSGCLLWYFGYGFWPLLIGELLFGFGDAFSSGTRDAYIYDLSKQYKQKNRFHNILSKQTSIEKGGFFFAACTGAFVFQFWGANGAILATMLSYLTACLLYLILPEIKEAKRKVENKSHLFDILGLCHKALKHREICLLIMVYAILAGNMSVFHWGLQPLMMEQSFPPYMYSLVVGASILAWSFWSAVSGRILEKISFGGVAWVSFGSYCLAYCLVWLVCFGNIGNISYLLLPFVAFFAGNRELSGVASSTLINHRIASDERATVLSVRGLIKSLFMGGVLIAIKPLSEVVGVRDIFAYTALLLIPTFWICLKASRANLAIKPTK